MKIERICSLCLAAVLASTLSAQTVGRMEYFLDSDPGYGKGSVLRNIHVGSNALTFDLSTAREGAHVLYVRVQDGDGHWSATQARPLYIERLQDIVYVEYFIDSDPGVGNGVAVALPNQEYKAHLELPIAVDIDHLSLGEHEFFVRARDRFDQWTNVLSRKFTVVKRPGDEPDTPELPVAGNLARIEYFFDTDPGYGKGRPLTTPNTGANTYLMDFSGIDNGAHVLHLRAADDKGNWSATLARPFCIVPPVGTRITALEYYFDDANPAPGTATSIAVPASQTVPFAFEVNTSALPTGDHHFHVRARSENGSWSLVYSRPFRVRDATVGLAAVEWLMPMTISVQGTNIVLTDTDAEAHADRTVEVYALQGIRIASAAWPARTQQLSVAIAPNASKLVIVKVTDTETRQHTVRTLALP